MLSLPVCLVVVLFVSFFRQSGPRFIMTKQNLSGIKKHQMLMLLASLLDRTRVNKRMDDAYSITCTPSL